MIPLSRAAILCSITAGWSLVEAALAFLVGTGADSAMFIALAHLATVDILTSMLGRAQVSALARGERFAFDDSRSEALAFGVVSITSMVAAGSVAVRAVAHFHAAPSSLSSVERAGQMLLAAGASVILYVIARAKRAVAIALGSRAFHIDIVGTLYSSYVFAGVFLVTVALWAVPRTVLDPITALLIGALLAWQGIYGLRVALDVRTRRSI